MNQDATPKQLPRMAWWLIAALAGLFVVWVIAPQMVKVTIYKLSLMPAAVWVLYHIDLAINERERPHELLAEAEALRAFCDSQPQGYHETDECRDKLRRADDLDSWALHRYKRRTLLVAAGLIAVALGS